MEELQVGDEVIITIKGKITDISKGHGLCYKIDLPQKDFVKERSIWLNSNEILYCEVKEESNQEKMIFEVVDEKKQIATCKVLNDKTGQYEETCKIAYLTHEQLDNLIPGEPKLVIYKSRK